ncbi:MAG: DEAD/DEAH box helicase, partial [Bdellovibrionales bacterium]|nr:DEAD/DEAH box helicase [Bdellovibrionales bacterium]
AYQSIGLNWLRDLYELRLGAILADDMGLGKTIQTLGFFDYLHSEKELGNCLVVVPSTLIINWNKEMEKFVPHLPRTVLSGKILNDGLDEATVASLENPTGGTGGRVFICSYNFLSERSEWIQAQKWNLMVFDEAQSLKNLSSQRTQSARNVKSRFRVCLTGTPLENHIGEAFSIIDLSLPGALGTWSDFRKKYFANQGISYQQAQSLRLRMKPILLRRTKSEILSELPSKTEVVVPVPFSDNQRSIYKNIAMQWNSKVRESIKSSGESQSQLLMITALLRLRQACSDPSGLPEVSFDELPPKIEMLGESIQDIIESGESALVFTQFISTYDRVVAHLTQRNIPTFGLQGSMNQKQREKALNGFQEMEQGAVLVATLKTGGVGLNLTKASYVFHLDPWWNPAVENQATDRTHRIGQTKPVTVYRYIMQGSIEEKIEVLKERKRLDFQALFGDQETPHAGNLTKDRLSQEDFDYLLKDEAEL